MVSKPSVHPSSAGLAAFRPVARHDIRKRGMKEDCPSPPTATPMAARKQGEERKRPGQDKTFRSTAVNQLLQSGSLLGSHLPVVHLRTITD